VGAKIGLDLYGASQQRKSSRQQAAIYEKQGQIYDLQAAQYEKQAAFARSMGKYQAALETQRAGQTELQGELAQGEAAQARRQLVGAGKVAFAANGVLLEGRQQSAAAMWEQDEAASLAWESAVIRENAATEVYAFMANAKMAAAQGRMQASNFLAQAQTARLNAEVSRMGGEAAREAGDAAWRNAVIGSTLGAMQYGATPRS